MGVMNMTTLTASEARAKLYKLLNEAASSHHPTQITDKRANVRATKVGGNNGLYFLSNYNWQSAQ